MDNTINSEFVNTSNAKNEALPSWSLNAFGKLYGSAEILYQERKNRETNEPFHCLTFVSNDGVETLAFFPKKAKVLTAKEIVAQKGNLRIIKGANEAGDTRYYIVGSNVHSEVIEL